MRVATLAPLSVGLVRLEGRAAFVVAKATYALEQGNAVIQTEPQPISGDRWSSHATELAYSNDLTPGKEGVDLLIVGHAKSATPTTAIPVLATLDDASISLMATIESPAERIPLTSDHLRTPDGQRARTAPAPSRSVGVDILGPRPGSHNVAPRPHRLKRYGAGMLTLAGLLDPRSPIAVQLPSVAPRVTVDIPDDSKRIPVTVRCDTIWIDVDGPTMVLVFRGALPRGLPDSAYLVVGLNDLPSHESIAQQPHLVNWTDAIDSDSESSTGKLEAKEEIDDDDDDETQEDGDDDEDGLLETAVRDRGNLMEEIKRRRAETERMLPSELAALAEETTQVIRTSDGPESRTEPSAPLPKDQRKELEEAGTMVGAHPGNAEEPETLTSMPLSARPPSMDMESYAGLLARMERTTNEHFLLSEHNMTRPEWKMLQRSWNRLSREDPKVARALRRALADARSKIKQ